MSVSATRSLSAALYTPFRTSKRGGGDASEPVGTLHMDAEVTGDAGGGTVTLIVAGRREEFGFPQLFVPTLVTVQDNLAAAEDVSFAYLAPGNDRLNAAITLSITSVRAGSVTNAGFLDNVTIPIQGPDQTNRDICQAFWATNTDTKVYHLHLFGPVYDAQILANSDYGRIALPLSGVR